MIEKIVINDMEVKSGVSKSGRGYNLVVIGTKDGRKMSMYVDKEFDTKAKKMEKIQDWQEGAEVSVVVEQNGDYLNFGIPSRLDILEDLVETLANKLAVLEIAIRNAKKSKED